MKLRIVKNSGWNVWKNFAIETYLLNHVKSNEIILYLWQSSKCAMLGKNQNPWRECNVQLLNEEEGKLARRITGGGTIYCDKGNMLFSYIVPKELYDLDKQLSVILRACETRGIMAEKSGRNDLTIDGKKFSGNAFYQNKKVGLHHGSLLINEDVENMVRYLTPSLEKVSSKGIKSVRSRVTNLSDHNPDVTMQNFKDIISGAMIEVYNHDELLVEEDPEWFGLEEITKTYNHYKSWDWVYGNSAETDIVLENRFDWGEVQLHFKLKKSYIDRAQVFSDALDQDYIGAMANLFIGKPFDKMSIVNAIGNYGEDEIRLSYSSDIKKWLESEAI